MKNLKSVFKILFINFVFFSCGLIFVELILRIKINSKINIQKPIKTIGSVSKALLNINSEWAEHLNQKNLYRKPHPYLMFKGMPNKIDHNNLGFRIKDPIDKSTFNIAFFGGSTGYSGEPPIINLMIKELNKNSNKKLFSPLNFSVVSSNHNQHLHSLIENSHYYPIDLIIFYGGYNETIQTAFYDSRPGYPYNFDKRNEMSPEMMLLSKHFALYKYFEKLFPNKYRKKLWTNEWNREIKDNYVLTIEKARDLSKILTTGRCSQTFMFILQPFNNNEEFGIDKEFKNEVYIPLSRFASNSKDGLDLSQVFNSDKSFYSDIVHLNQKGREFISKKIVDSNLFKKVISNCRKEKDNFQTK